MFGQMQYRKSFKNIAEMGVKKMEINSLWKRTLNLSRYFNKIFRQRANKYYLFQADPLPLMKVTKTNVY